MSDTRDAVAMDRDWKRLDEYLDTCAKQARAHQPVGLPPCAFVAPHELDKVRAYVKFLQARCVEYAGMLGGAHWFLPRGDDTAPVSPLDAPK